jgi:hypothetical protein
LVLLVPLFAATMVRRRLASHAQVIGNAANVPRLSVSVKG